MFNTLHLNQAPAFLFHGSPRRDLAFLRPALDKPLHASDDIRLALTFLARPEHCFCARNRGEVRVWIAENQEDFCRRDQGGSIYILQSRQFSVLGSYSDHAESWEFTTQEPVVPLLKIDYSSAFAAFRAHGVQVEFVSWQQFARLDPNARRRLPNHSRLIYASGILPISRSSSKICLARRSRHVRFGSCWGTLGGAVPIRQSLRDSACRELREETGYKGEIQLHAVGTFARGSFRYHNYLGAVNEEFEFSPSQEHVWENDCIAWRSLSDWRENMRLRPTEFHPGVLYLFSNNFADIQAVIRP